MSLPPITITNGVSAESGAAPPTATVGSIEPLAVRASEAARVCGVSLPTWERWRRDQLIPAPCLVLPRKSRTGGKVRGSSTVLWSVEDLRRWVQLGMPDQRTFEARRGPGPGTGPGDGATGRGRAAR